VQVVKARCEAFGAVGWASKIKVIPAAEVAKRYAKGELDPKISPAKAAA
jgi:fructose-bisphosphate aldolase, class II